MLKVDDVEYEIWLAWYAAAVCPVTEYHARHLHDFLCCFIYLFIKYFYLFIHERHTERERLRHRQREKQAPRREPDVGLDPRSPGSCPGLKAALNR